MAGTKVAVSEAIQDLVARLAERLHEESDQRIAAFSEKQSGEVAALNETIASLRHDVESFRSQSEHLALSLSAEKSSHAETQTKLQDERIASAQVRQRLQDMEGNWRPERRIVSPLKTSIVTPGKHWSISVPRPRNNENRNSDRPNNKFNFCEGSCVLPPNRSTPNSKKSFVATRTTPVSPAN